RSRLEGALVGAVSELHHQLIMFGGRDRSLSNEPGRFHSKRLSKAELQWGNRGENCSVKPSTLVISTKMETGAFSLAGSSAASVRHVITAGKQGHIGSRRLAGVELNLPAKSSNQGRAGKIESPFTLAASWIMLGSSRSSALTAGSGVVADIGRPEVAQRLLSCLSSASRLLAGMQ
ncbi:hypothetical protein GOODEAATRI_034152, partial [Goodea atripinnis]